MAAEFDKWLESKEINLGDYKDRLAKIGIMSYGDILGGTKEQFIDIIANHIGFDLPGHLLRFQRAYDILQEANKQDELALRNKELEQQLELRDKEIQLKDKDIQLRDKDIQLKDQKLQLTIKQVGHLKQLRNAQKKEIVRRNRASKHDRMKKHKKQKQENSGEAKQVGLFGVLYKWCCITCCPNTCFCCENKAGATLADLESPMQNNHQGSDLEAEHTATTSLQAGTGSLPNPSSSSLLNDPIGQQMDNMIDDIMKEPAPPNDTVIATQLTDP